MGFDSAQPTVYFFSEIALEQIHTIRHSIVQDYGYKLSRYFSASRAAMQPVPAEVTA